MGQSTVVPRRMTQREMLAHLRSNGVSEDCLLEIAAPTLCECGCGEGVNPLYDQIRVRREKRMSFAVIAKEMGIAPAYAQMLHRKRPRFIKGHNARKTEWITVTCEGCGHEFSTSRDTGRTFCRTRYCQPSTGSAAARQWGVRLGELAERESQRQRDAIKDEKRGWARAERLKRQERERESKKRIREFRKLRRQGGKLPWEIDPPPELVRSETDAALLAAVVAEQAKEMGRREAARGEWTSKQVWGGRSLDERLKLRGGAGESDGGMGSELYDTVSTGTSAEDEFFEQEKARELRAALGDLTLERINALHGASVDRLRERLAEAGLGPNGIQAKERERLKDIQPHRSTAPAPLGKSGTKHHHHYSSSEASELMKGKRSSRKPRRRRDEKDVWDWKG